MPIQHLLVRLPQEVGFAGFCWTSQSFLVPPTVELKGDFQLESHWEGQETGLANPHLAGSQKEESLQLESWLEAN